MNHLYWRIPSSIDLESLLKKHPPQFKTKYKIDYFYYFIELLCDMMEYNDLDGNGGYVNLNAQLMQAIVHNYKEYLDYLLKHRIFKTDKKYIVGSDLVRKKKGEVKVVSLEEGFSTTSIINKIKH